MLSMEETVKTKRVYRRTPRLSYSQEMIVMAIRHHGGQASSKQIKEYLLADGFKTYNELIQTAHRKGVIVRKRVGVYVVADPLPFKHSLYFEPLQTKTP